MAAYKELASVYDELMGEEIYAKFNKIITSMINKYDRTAKSVLELGCGTGNILIPLSKKFETTGLDISKEMLAIARKKDKKSKYIQADMTSFRLNKKFDVILCMYDTINHLKVFDDWQKTFKNTYNHLSEKGLFIFDFNTQAKFDSFKEPKRSWSKLMDTIVLSQTSSRNDLALWDDIILKKKGNMYKMFSDQVVEKTFPLKKVEAALISAGFKVKQIFDENGKGPNKDSRRLFVTCMKELIK
ncbi:Ubiquinone/menaquinone biosynthesis C-methyltransferase UbiE [Candidatus Tiddalikarchaeum anstoanum]|nr:Ubiquinone/menaquinone biosynthesis C-methyltransferase UbiE [Candidatus Tiddalikarchaeum anstoanum]